VLRRNEETRLSSTSDDEVGGLQSAIRTERSEQFNADRAAVLRRNEETRLSSTSDDEVGGLQSAIRTDQAGAPLSCTSERTDASE
jgi:hypothetical protein